VPAIVEDKQISSKDLRKPLRHKKLVFRCMIYPHSYGDRLEYIAECIDLDIIVRGGDAKKAFESLQSAISGYMQVAVNGDSIGLLPRLSPWTHRAKYHLFALRAALSPGMRSFLLTDLPQPC
jgi:hypothetical protein